MNSKDTDVLPTSLGEHLKKRRLELGLTQKALGTRLGVTSFTITNWEHDLTQPAIQYFPAIYHFLGYDPAPPSSGTLPDWLVLKRRELGWSQRVAAQKLGVDPSTWAAWEHGGTILTKEYRRAVARFIGLPETDLESLMQQRWSNAHGKATT